MGIFKESLPDYIRDQLEIRQEIIMAGNVGLRGGGARYSGDNAGTTEDATANFNKSTWQTRFTPRSANTSRGEVTIDPGAFYINALHKNCVVRMSSMVDLQDDRYIIEDTLTERNGRFQGPGMALTYILEGGTIIKGARKNKIVENDDGTTSREISINQKGVMRRGFPHASQLLGGTYGDPIIRSNASQGGGFGSTVDGDGYGIVPMPGITGVDIKTKSAYGSLREGKIKFECHNLRQLEVLEMLYMRPGYPVLVEWQWSQFVNNKGKITEGEQWISDLPNFWDASKVTQTGISENIVSKRENSGGNYDAILGFCKNFSYKARPDGGFSCTTELMAAGEVLNSIKGNMMTRKNPNGKDKEDMPFLMHLLNTMVDGVIGLLGGAEGVGDEGEDAYYPTFESDEAQEEFNKASSTFFKNYIKDQSSLGFNITEATFNNAEQMKKLEQIFNMQSAESNNNFNDGDPTKEGGGKESKGQNFEDWVEDFLVTRGYVHEGPMNVGQKNQGSTKLKCAAKKPYDDDVPAAECSAYLADHQKALDAWAGTAAADSEEATSLTKWQKERRAYWGEAIKYLEKQVQAKNAEVMDEISSAKWVKGVHIIGPNFDKTAHKNKLGGKMGYIRLDAFCQILNNMIIPKNTKDGRPIISFQTNNCNTQANEENGKLRFDQFRLNDYSPKFKQMFLIEGIDLDVSVDPYVCLLPHQLVDMDDSEEYGNSDVSGNEMFYKPINDTSGYLTEDIPDNVFYGEGCYDEWISYDRGTSGNQGNLSYLERAKRSIGLIYLNIDMLHKKCHTLQRTTGNEHFSLGKFMSDVVDEVNKAIGGNHKLGMVNNQEYPNVINIVDLNANPACDTFDDVAVINVQSNASVVRQWSFNTEIPSAMSATIAVAAQNPNDPNALDEVTFAAINRGIRNRLYRPTSAPGFEYTKEERERKLATLNRQIDDLGSKLGSLRYYNKLIMERNFEKDDDNRQERVANQKSTLMGIQTLVDVLATKDDNGLPRGSGLSEDDDGTPHNPPSSTPIPIKVDLTFDGIGGLVIGQLFRVDESRLPRQYRRQNIVFLVKSESQKIDAGGNWTTKISGQMQLFPSPPKTFELDHNMEGILEGAIKIAKKKTEELDNVDQGTKNDDYDNSDNLLKEEQAAAEKLIADRTEYLRYVWGQAGDMWYAIKPSDEDEATIEDILDDIADGIPSEYKNATGEGWNRQSHIRLFVTYYEQYGAFQPGEGRMLLWDIDDSYNKVSKNISNLVRFCNNGGLGWSGNCKGGWNCQTGNYRHPTWIKDTDDNGDFLYNTMFHKFM